jgi:alcohol dehydrogenase
VGRSPPVGRQKQDAMRALLFDEQLKYSASISPPAPPPGETLVRVSLAGICNTDIEITRGYMGYRGILGHEFVGIAQTGPLEGQRVVGEINATCGECVMCRSSNRTHCVRRTVLGISNRQGAMAEWLMLPEENLHAVPDSVADEHAVFVEPLAAAVEILEQIHIRPTERVIIIGDGKLGQLAAQVLALTGCALTLVGRHPGKLARARQRSIETCIEGKATALKGADVVVDCAGSGNGLALAAQLVRARGRIVLKSTFHGSQTIAMTPLVVSEVTLVGSRCGPFDAALRLLLRGLVDVGILIDEVMPLSRGVEAFARAQAPGVMKVLLRPGE